MAIPIDEIPAATDLKAITDNQIDVFQRSLVTRMSEKAGEYPVSYSLVIPDYTIYGVPVGELQAFKATLESKGYTVSVNGTEVTVDWSAPT